MCYFIYEQNYIILFHTFFVVYFKINLKKIIKFNIISYYGSLVGQHLVKDKESQIDKIKD